MQTPLIHHMNKLAVLPETKMNLSSGILKRRRIQDVVAAGQIALLGFLRGNAFCQG